MIGAALGLVLALAGASPPGAHAAIADRARNTRLLGGHIFETTDIVRVRRTRTPPAAKNVPPEFRVSRRLVQIVRPKTASERRWNAAMRAWLRAAETMVLPGEAANFDQVDWPGQVTIEIEIASASPEIISAHLNASEYSGQPHPNSTSRTMLWSVARARPLANAELFADPRNPQLVALVQDRLDRQGCEKPDLAEAKLTVEPDGIRFIFDPYELGGYPCGGDSLIGWREAGPFLRKSLPFDRRQLQAPRR